MQKFQSCIYIFRSLIEWHFQVRANQRNIHFIFNSILFQLTENIQNLENDDFLKAFHIGTNIKTRKGHKKENEHYQ